MVRSLMPRPPRPRAPTPAAPAAAGPRPVDGVVQGDDARFDRTLRPQTFADYIGQTKHKENLRVFVEAARRRSEPLDHMLLCGPPGLGKTTLAQILAHEMGVQLHMTNGPVVEHKGALAGLLTKLAPHDILFIDEIHRLNPVVEESLYPAMEDFRIDIMAGEGPFASAIQLPVQPFTLVGATTRTGLLTAPLYSRFGHIVRLDFYPVDDSRRSCVGAPGSSTSRWTRLPPRRSRSGREGRLASPTGCSVACATSPRCWARAPSMSPP